MASRPTNVPVTSAINGGVYIPTGYENQINQISRLRDIAGQLYGQSVTPNEKNYTIADPLAKIAQALIARSEFRRADKMATDVNTQRTADHKGIATALLKTMHPGSNPELSPISNTAGQSQTPPVIPAGGPPTMAPNGPQSFPVLSPPISAPGVGAPSSPPSPMDSASPPPAMAPGAGQSPPPMPAPPPTGAPMPPAHAAIASALGGSQEDQLALMSSADPLAQAYQKSVMAANEERMKNAYNYSETPVKMKDAQGNDVTMMVSKDGHMRPADNGMTLPKVMTNVNGIATALQDQAPGSVLPQDYKDKVILGADGRPQTNTALTAAEAADPNFIDKVRHEGVDEGNAAGQLKVSQGNLSFRGQELQETRAIRASSQWTPEAISNAGYRLAVLGDSSVLKNVGRGTQGGATIAAIQSAGVDALHKAGLSAADTTSATLRMVGAAAAARTTSNIIAKTDYGANELTKAVPLALSAVAALPRGNFVPFTQLKQMVQSGNSDPRLGDLMVKHNAVLNAYNLVAARAGTALEDRRRNIELLNTARSPADYAARANAMLTEAGVAKAAGAQTIDQVVAQPHQTTTQRSPLSKSDSDLLAKYSK